MIVCFFYTKTCKSAIAGIRNPIGISWTLMIGIAGLLYLIYKFSLGESHI